MVNEFGPTLRVVSNTNYERKVMPIFNTPSLLSYPGLPKERDNILVNHDNNMVHET